MKESTSLVIGSSEFVEKIEELKNNILQKTIENSTKKTPKNRTKQKGKYTTVKEDYLRAELTRLFVWSYIPVKQETVHFEIAMQGTAITIRLPYAEKTLGRLEIIDQGITRVYPAPGYQCYQYLSGSQRTWDTLVNPEITARGAWSRGLSFAVNRLTRIGDDVYEKTIVEYELKESLQKELFNYRYEASDETKKIVDNNIAEFGELKDLPEQIAINIINFIKEKNNGV